MAARHSCLLVMAIMVAAAAPALAGPSLVALSQSGAMMLFDAEHPGVVREVRPRVRARLIGLDLRPADGRLYGVAVTNDVYRIDPASGAAELISTLTIPFDGDVHSGVDFNPQADRLRLVSDAGQDLRVNVMLGATAVDRPLAYGPGDVHAGQRPHVTAAAYSNNVKDAPTTKLFEIDCEADSLVVQDPPNDGVLATIGPLGVDFGPLGGFDIISEHGTDQAWASSGASLYRIDLGTGRATPSGSIGNGREIIVSLSALPAAP